MSFFRFAVLVGLGIAMMPSDKAQQQALYQKASAAVDWTVTFCDRNRATCTRAGEAWEVFKAKAEFAGGLAYDAAITYVTSKGPGFASGQNGAAAAPHPVSGRDTLNADDLVPAWRGQTADAAGL